MFARRSNELIYSRRRFPESNSARCMTCWEYGILNRQVKIKRENVVNNLDTWHCVREYVLELVMKVSSVNNG